jgi:3-hydroxyacyl-CoA dehydrogenase
MLDLAGLDIGDPDAPRAALLKAGRKGQKSGAGFYNYAADRKGARDEAALELVGEALGAKLGTTTMAQDDLLARLLYPMINEGAKILEEGIALRASDIDMVYVTGYGWPAHKGGPMFYADLVGLPMVVAALKAMPGISLSPLLEKLAAEGGKFNG